MHKGWVDKDLLCSMSTNWKLLESQTKHRSQMVAAVRQASCVGVGQERADAIQSSVFTYKMPLNV